VIDEFDIVIEESEGDAPAARYANGPMAGELAGERMQSVSGQVDATGRGGDVED
jgi:hypothetical protein